MVKHLYPQQQASLSQLSAMKVLCSGFQHGATTCSGYILSSPAPFSASLKYSVSLPCTLAQKALTAKILTCSTFPYRRLGQEFLL